MFVNITFIRVNPDELNLLFDEDIKRAVLVFDIANLHILPRISSQKPLFYIHLFCKGGWGCGTHLSFPGRMMNHRFNLFNAGFNAYAPTVYYSKLALLSDLEKEEDDEIKKALATINASLSAQVEQNKSYISYAIKAAQEFELPVPEIQPSNYTDYNEWLKQYIETVESQFPMSRIDHYYFLY